MLVFAMASVMMACGSKGTETQVEEVPAVDSTEVVTDSTAVDASAPVVEETVVEETPAVQ